jgi:hypothetical protein
MFAETVESRAVRVDGAVVAAAWLRRRAKALRDRFVGSIRALGFFRRWPNVVAIMRRIGMPQCSSIRPPCRC